MTAKLCIFQRVSLLMSTAMFLHSCCSVAEETEIIAGIIIMFLINILTVTDFIEHRHNLIFYRNSLYLLSYDGWLLICVKIGLTSPHNNSK